MTMKRLSLMKWITFRQLPCRKNRSLDPSLTRDTAVKTWLMIPNYLTRRSSQTPTFQGSGTNAAIQPQL